MLAVLGLALGVGLALLSGGSTGHGASSTPTLGSSSGHGQPIPAIPIPRTIAGLPHMRSKPRSHPAESSSTTRVAGQSTPESSVAPSVSETGSSSSSPLSSSSGSTQAGGGGSPTPIQKPSTPSHSEGVHSESGGGA